VQQALAKINIVGTGPGSPDYVTPAAKKAVRQAQVVIGAQRSLDLFADDIKGEKMVLTAKNLKAAIEFGVESARKNKNVALLSTGDPGFSGLLHTVLESGLVKAEEINVIPGVSSIQTCAARLGMSWDDVCLFTFHEGKVSVEDKNRLLSCVRNGKNVMILPDPKAFPPSEIACFLLKAGVKNETHVSICENLTLPNEKVTSCILEEASEGFFGSLCVMVIKARDT
jgi:cobalt-precorrin-7 (C5)-methyltransferase